MNLSHKDNRWIWVDRAGTVLLVVSAGIVLLTFFPVLWEEAKYQLFPKHDDVVVLANDEARAAQEEKQPGSEVVVPVDSDFGIVIPKIGANAKVVPDVDWQDEQAYQQALTRGVAHAKGTARPGEPGNVFIFSHSGVDFFEANRYNALFYLIDKLQSGDEIVMLYQKEAFTYRVTEKKIVAPESVEYLKGSADHKTLTLMTCYPAGTTLKRLVVIAEQVANP